MVHTWTVTIPALSGEETRNLYLYLPEDYQNNTEKRYPVLYMFDGHNLFFDKTATYGKCWGLKEYLDKTRTDLIVVGMECNHGANYERVQEYSPYSFSDKHMGHITGKGKITMEWIVNELKPVIDREFRTLPDRKHTLIAGSSMGGLISYYGVTAYNHVFSRAAMLSPSLWTNPKKLRALAESPDLSPDTILYMDFGSQEMEQHPEYAKKVRKLANILFKRGIYTALRIVPEGEHCEASWEKQLPIMMNTILYNIREDQGFIR